MHHSDEQRKEVNHGDEVELIVVKHWKDSIYIAGFDPVVEIGRASCRERV